MTAPPPTPFNFVKTDVEYWLLQSFEIVLCHNIMS